MESYVFKFTLSALEAHLVRKMRKVNICLCKDPHLPKALARVVHLYFPLKNLCRTD